MKIYDDVMFWFFAHTWSFADVLVLLVIIPELCREYSLWLLLLVIPWLMYSSHKANEWHCWKD